MLRYFIVSVCKGMNFYANNQIKMQKYADFCIFLYNYAMFPPVTFHQNKLGWVSSMSSVISGGENLKNITIFFVSLKNSCNFDLSV